MKEENKDFYFDGCDTDAIDMQIEAFDELVEDIMLEAFKHMSAAEKLDAKKYRMSVAGKKAIARHLKKASRAGYKIDKKRSRLMQKVGAFARHESEDLDFDINDESICEELYNTLTTEDLADFDALVEEIVAFAEACKEDCMIDPETGDKDDVDEAFKHMTAAQKQAAKKYRMSAAGKKALKKYLKKASRAGYKVNRQRSKLMKKVGSFARHESEDLDFINDLNITEEELDAIDELIGDVLIDANNILSDMEISEGCKLSKLKVDEDDEIKIEVPVDSQDEFDAIVNELDDDIEVISRDEENGINIVKGTIESLRALLDAMGYDDPIEDLVYSDDDDDDNDDDNDVSEAFKHMTAAQKQAAKKYRRSAAGKKAIARYLKKSSRAGYRVDKKRSKQARKVAQFRNEAIQENLDQQFSSTPLFESLNEAESTELKSIVHNVVSSILNQSYDKIADDVTSDYESYMSEEVFPKMCSIFEDYKTEIIRNLNEEVEEYLDYVARNIVEKLDDNKLIVKSQKSKVLEEFSESLLDLIKEKLNIVPEQENVLYKNEETIRELSDAIQESKVEKYKMKNQLDEARREIYVLKNIPAELSEQQKENLIDYANEVLSEAETFTEFKTYFDNAVEDAKMRNFNINDYNQNKSVIDNQTTKNFDSLAESLFRMGKI